MRTDHTCPRIHWRLEGRRGCFRGWVPQDRRRPCDVSKSKSATNNTTNLLGRPATPDRNNAGKVGPDWGGYSLDDFILILEKSNAPDSPFHAVSKTSLANVKFLRPFGFPKRFPRSIPTYFFSRSSPFCSRTPWRSQIALNGRVGSGDCIFSISVQAV